MGPETVNVDSGDRVAAYFLELQANLCSMLQAVESQAAFIADPQNHPGGGVSRPLLLAGGDVIEKAAVNFSRSKGDKLPAAASKARPHVAGCGFEAMAISLIVHPVNPHVPTTHANLRLFLIKEDEQVRDWWFGGGFDLTPFYGYEADCVHWHSMARAACETAGVDVYPELKSWCDRYFYLTHRQEARGVGGIFFDDWKRGGFEESFSFVRSVGDHFIKAYDPILKRRMATAYGERERAFQLYRRGRYVEFNLVHDRGTKYGLQSGKRTETVMASMPPLVSWVYKYEPDPNSPEARLYSDFLPARDWLDSSSTDSA